ncbi:hypothetical protein J6590_044166 [Homalodisca vitripennis]|nr:hypothetical protein J6590_044166 [Homalodisca vitripennis]
MMIHKLSAERVNNFQSLDSSELWSGAESAEREVIPHRHLQSPLTSRYFSPSSGTSPSASLQSLLSPSLDTRRLHQLAAAAAPWEY